MIDHDALAASLYAANRAGSIYVPPSTTATLSVADAYRVQDSLIRRRAGSDPIAGYKTAVNAEAAQQRLGLGTAITGALFTSGSRQPGARIARSTFHALAIETEIGFRLRRRVEFAITDLDALRRDVDCCAVIELADPAFGRTRFTGTDLIATNAAAAACIAGPELAAGDVDGLRIELARDGVTLYQAAANEVMGSQWQALAWLLNQLVARGHAVDAGQLLITGAIGTPQPGLPGAYRASFGSQYIDFTVTD